jgi:hypothetical protein
MTNRPEIDEQLTMIARISDPSLRGALAQDSIRLAGHRMSDEQRRWAEALHEGACKQRAQQRRMFRRTRCASFSDVFDIVSFPRTGWLVFDRDHVQIPAPTNDLNHLELIAATAEFILDSGETDPRSAFAKAADEWENER